MRKTVLFSRALLALCVAAVGGGVAQAQETVLIEPAQIPDYDRGRNVSVLQRPRPDYDALGIRRGSFLIQPRVLVGAGASDNVYLTEVSRESDIYALIAPSVTVDSDWSRHQLSLAANGAFRRYSEETLRNQDEWNLAALGRADLGSQFALTMEAQASRTQESPFGGAVAADVAALSAYHRQLLAARGQFTSGRTRITLAYDFHQFDFEDLTFSTGTRLSQADRDRQIHRVLVQGERALSPSLSVFAQAGYGEIDYDRTLLNGQANRDSHAFRAVGGVHFDLSAFMRGSIGVGYVRRDYNSALYRDVSGVSVEGRVEYFPDELTSVLLNVRRILDDSNIGGTSAFFNNEIALRADREVRENLLLNISAAYAHQDYIDTPFNSDVFRVSGGGRYLVSRSLQLQANIGYGSRVQPSVGGSATIRELAADIGIVLQR